MSVSETSPVSTDRPSPANVSPRHLVKEKAGRTIRELTWPQARALTQKQLDKLMALEAKVLRGDHPESVHAMRVASRRLQEEMDLIWVKPRASELRRSRRMVRRCRCALSSLRNCDVLLVRAEARVAASGSTRRQAWETVVGALRQRREVLFAKAVRKLTRINLPEVYLELREHLIASATLPDLARNGQGQAGAGEQPQPAAPLRQRLAEELRCRWEELQRHADEASEDLEQSSLHASRIATKKLRYLTEVAVELEVEGSIKALAQLKILQSRLGDWHDLEMSEVMLTRMVGNTRFIRESLGQVPPILKLIELDRNAKERLRRKSLEALHRMARSGGIQAWINTLQ